MTKEFKRQELEKSGIYVREEDGAIIIKNTKANEDIKRMLGELTE